MHFDYADLTQEEAQEIIDRRGKQKYIETMINVFESR
jgi:hypothetical protein